MPRFAIPPNARFEIYTYKLQIKKKSNNNIKTYRKLKGNRMDDEYTTIRTYFDLGDIPILPYGIHEFRREVFDGITVLGGQSPQLQRVFLKRETHE